MAVVWGGNFAAGEAAKRASDVDQAGEATQWYEVERPPTQISFQGQRSNLQPESRLIIMFLHFLEDSGGQRHMVDWFGQLLSGGTVNLFQGRFTHGALFGIRPAPLLHAVDFGGIE